MQVNDRVWVHVPSRRSTSGTVLEVRDGECLVNVDCLGPRTIRDLYLEPMSLTNDWACTLALHGPQSEGA